LITHKYQLLTILVLLVIKNTNNFGKNHKTNV
jgi:hypothetical protein